ncbi:MAG: hypothetical protein QXI77_03410, partial [Nanopusillaceae archaeon]
MDKKIILLIILSFLFVFVSESAVNFVNIYPPNQKIEVLGYVNSTNLGGNTSYSGNVICDLHYPYLACTWASDYLYTHSSQRITIFNLITNRTFTVSLRDYVQGLAIYYNQTSNILRVYYINGVAPGASYSLKYLDIFLNNLTYTSPTSLISQTSNSNQYSTFIYYAKTYTFMYVNPPPTSNLIYIWIFKNNGSVQYSFISHNFGITFVGDYLIRLNCYASTAGHYTFGVIGDQGFKTTFSHYTYTSSCRHSRIYTNYAVLGTYYHSYDGFHEAFTYNLVDYLYRTNKIYNISSLSQS